MCLKEIHLWNKKYVALTVEKINSNVIGNMVGKHSSKDQSRDQFELILKFLNLTFVNISFWIRNFEVWKIKFNHFFILKISGDSIMIMSYDTNCIFTLFRMIWATIYIEPHCSSFSAGQYSTLILPSLSISFIKLNINMLIATIHDISFDWFDSTLIVNS